MYVGSFNWLFKQIHAPEIIGRINGKLIYLTGLQSRLEHQEIVI